MLRTFCESWPGSVNRKNREKHYESQLSLRDSYCSMINRKETQESTGDDLGCKILLNSRTNEQTSVSSIYMLDKQWYISVRSQSMNLMQQLWGNAEAFVLPADSCQRQHQNMTCNSKTFSKMPRITKHTSTYSQMYRQCRFTHGKWPNM